MKHSFIINPAAGNGRDQEIILPRILDAVKNWRADYEIHRTSGPGEATIFARGRLDANPGETIRFYACGGDGTVAEVLNGIYGNPDAELAIIPTGSGNDFIRNFGTKEQFLDITAQLGGQTIAVDVIHYTFTPKNGEGVQSRYSINMINMGFDAMVVSHMERIKNKLFLKGTGAYVAGVVRQLIGYKMSRAEFCPDSAEGVEKDFLLAGVGNGQFSGGGFDGIPCAVVDDGLLDLIIIEPITRRRFLRLVGSYHDGRHMNNPMFKDIMHLSQIESITIKPVHEFIFTADGEVHATDNPITIAIAPERVRFVISSGIER